MASGQLSLNAVQDEEAEDIEVDVDNSIFELDNNFEFDAPQWFDFSDIDELYAPAHSEQDQSWFDEAKPYVSSFHGTISPLTRVSCSGHEKRLPQFNRLLKGTK